MITYVNTVFVSNTNNPAIIEGTKTLKGTETNVAGNVGKFVFDKKDDLFRIGLVKDGVLRVHSAKTETYANIVKSSNWIDKNYIKSATFMLADAYKKNTKLAEEDTITIDFTGCDDNDPNEFAQGNRRIVVRLTFKDMPTRFRKWTESYEYVTKHGDKGERRIIIRLTFKDMPTRYRKWTESYESVTKPGDTAEKIAAAIKK